MRGKEPNWITASKKERITPAGAGKRVQTAARPVSIQDHPRRCGEKRQSSCHHLCAVGSPPQVRGKVGSGMLLQFIDRITPAGAGKRLKGSLNIGISEKKSFIFHSVSSRPPAAICSHRVLCVFVVLLYPTLLQLFPAYNSQAPLIGFWHIAWHP